MMIVIIRQYMYIHTVINTCLPVTTAGVDIVCNLLPSLRHNRNVWVTKWFRVPTLNLLAWLLCLARVVESMTFFAQLSVTVVYNGPERMEFSRAAEFPLAIIWTCSGYCENQDIDSNQFTPISIIIFTTVYMRHAVTGFFYAVAYLIQRPKGGIVTTIMISQITSLASLIHRLFTATVVHNWLAQAVLRGRPDFPTEKIRTCPDMIAMSVVKHRLIFKISHYALRFL